MAYCSGEMPEQFLGVLQGGMVQGIPTLEHVSAVAVKVHVAPVADVLRPVDGIDVTHMGQWRAGRVEGTDRPSPCQVSSWIPGGPVRPRCRAWPSVVKLEGIVAGSEPLGSKRAAHCALVAEPGAAESPVQKG